MTLEDIVSLVVNNGIGAACIIYFMVRDYLFMQKLMNTLASLTATLNSLDPIIQMINTAKNKTHTKEGAQT